MLSAQQLESAVEQHICKRVEIKETINSAYHKFVWAAMDKQSWSKVIVKGCSLAGDENQEEKRLRRLYEVIRCSRDDKDLRAFVDFLDFDVRPGFAVMLFKGYNRSLRDVLQERKLLPFSGSQVKGIAYQLLVGLRYLHRQQLVHTDVKPDNIVLVDDSFVEFEDFEGGSFTKKLMLRNIHIRIADYDDCWDLRASARPRHAVGTLGYRAPEVVMRMPWSSAVDVFAFACTIAELYLGRPLFLTSIDTTEQMEMIERVLGKFPVAVVQRSFKHGHSVFSKRDHMVHKHDLSATTQTQRVKPINALIRRPDLQDLLRLCLHGDDDRRLTAHEAIEHCFFNGSH
ncbi:CMGC/CLK protein kinase [Coprinopsis sp. MPI-PUGE-AT-0042]|nr:CMGC/CLK protein kinase [Coprinopsis sp. MPI-PUGE-AT-0042]